ASASRLLLECLSPWSRSSSGSRSSFFFFSSRRRHTRCYRDWSSDVCSSDLISLDAMETGRRWFLAIWRNPLGTLALYGAITVHGVLALWLLYQRRSLRMPSWEAAQYGLGLVLPALLATHVVATRIAWWQVGTEDRYARVLRGAR